MDLRITIDNADDNDKRVLDFARERFNKVWGVNPPIDDNAIFLAKYLNTRVLPAFYTDEKRNFVTKIKTSIEAKLDNVTIELRSQVEQVVADILKDVPIANAKADVVVDVLA